MINKEESAASKQDKQRSPQVVLAVCDEPFGRAVVDFSTEYSWKGNPTFHMLFIVEVDGLPTIAPDLVSEIESDERKYGRDLTGALSKKISDALPNAQTVVHIGKGSPQSEILKLADSIHADMIVLGSHGRTGLRKLVLGSVSSDVVANAQCSTMVVHLDHAEEPLQIPGPIGITASDLPDKMTTYAPVEEAR